MNICTYLYSWGAVGKSKIIELGSVWFMGTVPFGSNISLSLIAKYDIKQT